MSDAVIGTEVDGYRIQAVLGRGGMGTVYRAEDVNLSRTVAIKRINPGQAERESFIHRFRSEAQALARIDSPHIVGVYALRETEIGLLIVMEYVRGGTLKGPIEEHGAISPVQAVPILEQIMQAFHDAHSAGVIHRDIKPENVMLTQDGMVKVTDFGIAKLRQPESGETVTQGGQGGTLKYMSPEQISNISAVDARSDLYSIGMTAYELLAGDLPFTESATDFDIMQKVVEGEIPPPDELNPDIPSGLAQWVMRAIQKEQDDRYQTAEEMLGALRGADDQVDHTKTQPDWEVTGGSTDEEKTRTIAPGDMDADETETVVPGGEDGDGYPEQGKETVLDPEAGVDASSDTPSSAPTVTGERGAEEDASGEGGISWTQVGTGVTVLLAALVGAVLAYVQLGGDSGATASLSLTTESAGALVLVNGDTAGTTPIEEYALEAGAVQLQVQRNDGSDWDTSFTAKGGAHVALDDVGRTRGSDDDARTVASNANGQSTGATGDDQTEGVDATGEMPAEQSSGETGNASDPAVSEDGDAEPAGEATEPRTGVLDVTPQPSGTVLVDGEPLSSGPLSLAVGEHSVTCRHPVYGTVETTVTVSAGETETLTCYFEHEVTVDTDGPYGQVWMNGSRTDESTPSTLSLGPGTYGISVRRETLDGFRVDGGIVKTERGPETEETDRFTGSTYQIEVEPTFVKVAHAIVFDVTRE